ncbi:cyclase family protein [Bradyrhizobium lablabi]|uniref:cyclase family protein n=1 Tax=Bradyrhizobium lablabi TaxID=722472 RepID=UPI001BA64775|nr:cyclase family protein [Bradyrhizobium lablabi]MBR0696388.1 cyclase family protein [Bradyrhizobium lablabi]
MDDGVSGQDQSKQEQSSGMTTDRRTLLRTAGLAGAAGATLAGAMHGKFALAPISEAQAQTAPASMPKGVDKPWWPSKWGKDDESGASNHITPAKVLDTVKWIKDGKIYRIGRVYEQGMPLFGARAFSLRIPGGPTGGPFGDNKLVYHDEFLATEIGQTGTQFDGLGHIGIQMGKDGDRSEMRFYNGFTAQEISDAYGLKKLGVERLKPLFTRAHLIDMVALKGGMMDAGQEITTADIKAALQKQNIAESDIKPGDAIMFHTGWGSLWMKNNDRFNSGEPGIGLDAAKWVVEKDLALTGADTWAVEVVPNPDKSLAFVVHAELQTKHGIHNHENLIFDDLIADKKYQFVYCFAPAPIKGATGSNGCPIAIT